MASSRHDRIRKSGELRPYFESVKALNGQEQFQAIMLNKSLASAINLQQRRPQGRLKSNQAIRLHEPPPSKPWKGRAGTGFEDDKTGCASRSIKTLFS
jgi:hypothetical protein